MELSAKMPDKMDSTLEAKMPAKMTSDAPPTGGDGPDKAPAVAINTTSSQQDNEWTNLNEKGQDWQTEDKKTGPADGWSMDDRKEGENG